MLPAYAPGDRVVVSTWSYSLNQPDIGDVVVLRDPEQLERWLVKRVAAAPDAAGCLTVLGDNAGASRDSRAFGPVDPAQVAGKVIFRY